LHNPGAAAVEIILLWAEILAMLIAFWKRSRWAAGAVSGMGEFSRGAELGDLTDQYVNVAVRLTASYNAPQQTIP